jgi:two-component system sensor histidine kinase YesM
MNIQINTFSKIIALLLLILVPLLLLYSYSNRVSQDVIEKEIMTTNLQKLMIFANRVEANVEQLSNMTVTLLLNPTVKKFSEMAVIRSEYERIDTVNKISEVIQVSSAWDNRISIYSTHAGEVITSSLLTQYDQEYLNRNVRQQWHYREQTMNGIEAGQFVRYTVDSFLPGLDRAKLVAEVSFASDNIRNMLNQHKSSGGGDPIFYTPGQKPVMNESANQALVEELIALMGQRQLEPKGTAALKLNGEEYLVQYVRLEALGWYLLDYVPLYHMMAPIEKSRNLYYMFTVILLLLSVVATLVVYRQVQVPIRRLIRSMQKVKKGFYSERIEGKAGSEFGFLFECFNSMTEQIQDLIEKVHVEEVRSREATLKQLQSQINPHFLYNCLYFIKNAAEYGDNQLVSVMAVSLGDYYRYTTKVDNPSTTLREELKLVDNYLRIQSLRMSRMSYAIEVPEEMLEQRIPRLLIQPIVENAIIHGLELKVGPGRICITGKQTNSENIITVEDNGDGMTPEQLEQLEQHIQDKSTDESGTGVRNVHQRLIYQFGGSSGLSLSSGLDGGVKVDLCWKRLLEKTRQIGG